MAETKKLMTIDYHTDDDSGMYSIGELDYGLGMELVDYCKIYGKANLMYLLRHKLPRAVEEFLDGSNSEEGEGEDTDVNTGLIM